jgi:hypothetical protein
MAQIRHIHHRMLPVLSGMALLLTSCAPAMLLDSNLQNDSDIFYVKSKSVFLQREILSFGPYYVVNISRTTPLRDLLNASMEVTKLTESIGFDMREGTDNRSSVSCQGKLGSEDLSFLKDETEDDKEDKDQFNKEQKDVFKGTIDCGEACGKWHFLVINGYTTEGDTSLGFLSNGSKRITINQVNTLSSGKVLKFYRLGFEFSVDSTVVGAVEITRPRKVIIKEDLPGNLSFVLANMSAALLLKSDLQDIY